LKPSATTIIALVCFTFLRSAQGQLNPAPDGDYGHGNTAEGLDAYYTYGRHLEAVGSDSHRPQG
ncbi:MAG TPA: hypothetical protein VJS37_08875, partial [Terriglobales bacterium]|nr:hypothetical protein [Terriglobales bacterium]